MELLKDVNSIPALLAALCVIGTLHVLFKLGEFVWKIQEKKEQLSDKTILDLTASVQRLDQTMHGIQRELHDIPKFKKELNRCFEAVKILAGPRWPDIRKSIMEEFQ